MEKINITTETINIEAEGDGAFNQAEKLLRILGSEALAKTTTEAHTDSINIPVTPMEENLCSPIIELGDLSCAMPGDYLMVELTNGKMARFDVTEIEDGAIRFDSHDCLGKTKWNETDTNEGGVAYSELQGYLDNEMYNLLPDYIKDRIVETERKYAASGDDDADIDTYTTKVFIPDASEVFPPEECYGASIYEQMEYYKDRRNRMKGEYPGAKETCIWWLASANSGNAAHACYVNGNGIAYDSNASGAFRVPVCFRLNVHP